jgi:hypothetical protein
MYRRVVSLLLLPTVLLTQWASAAHCHGCSQVPGHACNPHIHLTGFPFSGSVPQVEGQESKNHHRCSHHHDDQQSDDQDGSDQNGGNHENGAPVPHDEDSTDHTGGSVVYLPTAIMHGWLTGRCLTCIDDVIWTPGFALCDALFILVPPLACSHDPPPLSASSDCPIFLRILTLLI